MLSEQVASNTREIRVVKGNAHSLSILFSQLGEDLRKLKKDLEEVKKSIGLKK